MLLALKSWNFISGTWWSMGPSPLRTCWRSDILKPMPWSWHLVSNPHAMEWLGTFFKVELDQCKAVLAPGQQEFQYQTTNSKIFAINNTGMMQQVKKKKKKGSDLVDLKYRWRPQSRWRDIGLSRSVISLRFPLLLKSLLWKKGSAYGSFCLDTVY